MRRAVVIAFGNLIMSGLLSGCVGPMTPFGATPTFGPRASTEIPAGKPALDRRAARVRFSPERQVLHDQSSFSIILEDPQGVPEDYRLQVSYNGIDVTRAFLSQAQTTVMDPLHQQVKLTAQHLR